MHSWDPLGGCEKQLQTQFKKDAVLQKEKDKPWSAKALAIFTLLFGL